MDMIFYITYFRENVQYKTPKRVVVDKRLYVRNRRNRSMVSLPQIAFSFKPALITVKDALLLRHRATSLI